MQRCNEGRAATAFAWYVSSKGRKTKGTEYTAADIERIAREIGDVRIKVNTALFRLTLSTPLPAEPITLDDRQRYGPLMPLWTADIVFGRSSAGVLQRKPARGRRNPRSSRP